MSAAEGGKKVIKRNFVGDVNDSDLRTPSALVTVEEIIVSDSYVEEMARGDSRRIFVAVLTTCRRNADQR